jgi:hypothetical protein
MTQGLVLYTTGKFEVKKFSSGKKFLKELNDCVGGRIEMLPVLRNYYNTEKKEKSERLLGYINLNAGTAAIGVGWGYHPAEELKAAGAHEVVDAAHEVRPAWARAAQPRAGGTRWDAGSSGSRSA